ncbi:MAG: HAMP domain-containing sensor histidine kinase [Myxococcota bacterium]
MGWMAGTLAAVSFVPTSVPLIWQIIDAEEMVGRRQTEAAAHSVHTSARNGAVIDASSLRGPSLQHLTVVRDGARVDFGEPLEVDRDAVCNTDGSMLVRSGRKDWALSCVTGEGIDVIAGVTLDPRTPALRVMVAVVLLALFVGIVTSLGILRLLRPLSEISGALARVGAGERGVAVAQTGLYELDALVDRLNAAARSVDDREDAILSRITLVQEMARIVAHEIRNPLQSLELLTSLIASEDDPNERLAIGESIHTEIRTLEQVVNRLLTESAARGALRLQVTVQPVAPLVEQVVALRRPQPPAACAWLPAAPGPSVPCPTWRRCEARHRGLCSQRALQAVPRYSGEVKVSLLDEPDHLLILVDDNGPGVPEGMVDHIFEPDVTGREGGTGLGLTLVKGVVDAHGGSIRVERSPMGGARFAVRLPRRAPGDPPA